MARSGGDKLSSVESFGADHREADVGQLQGC